MATGFVRRSKKAIGGRKGKSGGTGTLQDRNLMGGVGSFTDHERFAPTEGDAVKMHKRMAGQP